MIGSYLRRIVYPDAYNGIMQSVNYFEGWYFKLISADKSCVLAVIVGVSRGRRKEDRHCFIQLINSVTGKSHYIRFAYEAFHAMGTTFDVQIENNRFCSTGIKLDIHTAGIEIVGKLDFMDIERFPKTFFRRSVMGPFVFVPFMECYHGIVNISERLMGSFWIDSQPFNFDGGNGYIEKDSGTSFPSSWLWIQANDFKRKQATFMLSIADIPWLGSSFVGMLSFLHIDGKYYSIASYNGAKIHKFAADKHIRITLENAKYSLVLIATQFEGSTLKAPSKGIMKRDIQESVTSILTIRFSDKRSGVIFEGSSENVGLETAGDWQTLFTKR